MKRDSPTPSVRAAARDEDGPQMLPDYSAQDRVDGSAWGGVGSHGATQRLPRRGSNGAVERANDIHPGSPRRRVATPVPTERCAGPSPEPLAVTHDCGPVLAGGW